MLNTILNRKKAHVTLNTAELNSYSAVLASGYRTIIVDCINAPDSILRSVELENAHTLMLRTLPRTVEGLSFRNCPNLFADIAQLETILAMCPKLTSLTITNCGLVELPELPETLRYLDVSRNKLIALPKLPDNLRVLRVMDNGLTNTPNYLPDTLTTLELDDNPFNGSSPKRKSILGYLSLWS